MFTKAKKYAFLIPLVIYILLNIVLFTKYGVAFGGDSPRYIKGAENIAAGLPLQGKQGSYISYLLFILFFHVLPRLDLLIVIFLQIIIGGIGVFCLYKLGELLQDKLTGLILSVSFIIFPDLIRWNFYILTEALFIWGTCIFLYMCARTLKKQKIPGLCVTLLIGLFIGLVRPNGYVILFVLPLLIYLFFIKKRRRVVLIYAATVILLAALFLIIFSKSAAADSTKPIYHLTNGTILWNNEEFKLLLPELTDLSVKTLFSHSIELFTLVLGRIFTTLYPLRYYYSLSHNITLFLYIIIMYPLFFIGLRKTKINKITIFPILIMTGNMVIVACTFSDYENRWLLYFLPCFLIYFSIALNNFLTSATEKLKTRKTNREKSPNAD